MSAVREQKQNSDLAETCLSQVQVLRVSKVRIAKLMQSKHVVGGLRSVLSATRLSVRSFSSRLCTKSSCRDKMCPPEAFALATDAKSWTRTWLPSPPNLIQP